MQQKLSIILIFIFALFLSPINFIKAADDFGARLSGKILLQVESKGEAWYIDPADKQRYYLGRPADAFSVMRSLGLGISNKDFNSFGNEAPKRLSGKILLKIEDFGKAYYVNPADFKMHYLGRPADAFNVMRNLGVGITDQNLSRISISGQSGVPAAGTSQDIIDKPVVELFVMSFCPYGVQAEAAMAPVIELLGAKADIKVRYIAGITGENLDSVRSLHGVIEGKEDARQLCIAKNYDQAILWKYITAINQDCYPIYRYGEEEYNQCWKNSAVNAGIDTDKIDNCLATEGVSLLKVESAQVDKYGVSGSPTLFINGLVFNGQRTAESYKNGICSAFKTAPSECSKTLSTNTNTPGGNCNN